MNIARQVRGPAYISYRGAEFYSKSAITAPFDPETFKIAVDAHGDDVDERIANLNLRVSFTPAGEFENLSVLFPHRTRQLGAPLHDIVKIGTINTTNEQVTISAHGRATGDRGRFARVGTGSAFPTLSSGSINVATTYFIRAVDANTVTFHPTAADAAGNTNPINFTGQATGIVRFMFFDPLTIYPLDTSIEPFRYENAIVTQMPSMALSATETLFGEVQFECFPIPGASWSDANSIFTNSGITPVSGSAFDPAAIKTLPYSAAWGSTFPWDDIPSENGFRFDFPMTLQPLGDDTVGIVSRQLGSLTAMCRATPKGITHGDFLAKVAIQGGSAGRGQSLIASADDLNVTNSGNVYVRLYNAALRRAVAQYTTKADQVGEVVWQSKREFTGGVPDPVFFVGTSAPA